jgi:hypothetical protein
LKDEANILTSIDGPNNNVLVMKPPMCFGIDDAETFLGALGNSCMSSLCPPSGAAFIASQYARALSLPSSAAAVVAMDALANVDLATISHTPT